MKGGQDVSYSRRKLFWTLRGGAFVVVVGLALASCVQDAPRQTDTALGPVLTTPARLAITIDDLPYVLPSQTTGEEGLRYIRQITGALQDFGITATGFVIGQQINPNSRPALQAFADAGHGIGNHSWSHPDYGTISSEEFLVETRRTDRALKDWIEDPRYYRFPFLREGETPEAKAAASAILAGLGYRNVPVTIDNDDWRFNADYLSALAAKDTAGAAAVADAYIAHMQERTAFFQTLATTELGADVDHILLIHLNRINADHLGTLLAWYAEQGWTFISVEDALTHPLYARPDIYVGPRGLSQIERVLGEPHG